MRDHQTIKYKSLLPFT